MQVIHSVLAPAAIGTYSQAIKVDKTVYLSGQIPLVADSLALCSENIVPQLKQAFANLAFVCEAAGGSLANLVKLNVYLTDLKHFPLVNELMTELFLPPFPARAVIGVASLPKGAQVEVDGVMVLV